MRASVVRTRPGSKATELLSRFWTTPSTTSATSTPIRTMQHKQRFIGEALRVLRPGGRFVMINIDPWSMNGWVLYRFFPAARALDYRDFMTSDDFSGAMRDAGFVNIQAKREHPSTCETVVGRRSPNRVRTRNRVPGTDPQVPEGERG